MIRTNVWLLISIWSSSQSLKHSKTKKKTIRAIAACQTLLIDTAIVFSSVPAKNQRVAIHEMLLKTCEKLRIFAEEFEPYHCF